MPLRRGEGDHLCVGSHVPQPLSLIVPSADDLPLRRDHHSTYRHLALLPSQLRLPQSLPHQRFIAPAHHRIHYSRGRGLVGVSPSSSDAHCSIYLSASRRSLWIRPSRIAFLIASLICPTAEQGSSS